MIRKKKEIEEYLEEAFHKVWYMRSHSCDNKEIEERRQKAIKEIETCYPEVKSYDDKDYGYWNGILGALRWVLGEEKDFLDT